MQILYYYPLCPFSRQVRLVFKELGINISLIKEDYWNSSEQLIKFNPTGELPVLVETFDNVIAGIYPIIEYVNDKNQNNFFMDNDPIKAAEVRRLLHWFNNKFYFEVSKVFIDEKLIRLVKNLGSPRMDHLRIAKSNLSHHIAYIAHLLSERSWLASDKMTYADFAAASHLSILDYFGEIIWDQYPEVKEWYALIKSRPSFRPFLAEQIAGFIPPKHYYDLDF
ncbi:MAG UNVERIFIED_CONTAM: glutathione S-transferase family protein [Rickettsiaceae bacterium]|jgi:glutathione S-transferase